MRRILILSNSTGGLVLFRKELLSALAEKYEVFVLSGDTGRTDEITGLGCRLTLIDVDRRGTNPLKDFGLLLKYLKHIKRINPDIVLTYTIKPNVYGGLACRIAGIPYIANVTGLGTSIENGGFLSRLSLLLYKIGLRKAHCVFFQNESNLKMFKERGIISGKAVLIPGSGVNTEAHCLEEYPPDEDSFRFLFVGRIMKDKGIEELLEAVKQLVSEGRSIKLDIVGGCDENYSDILKENEEAGFIIYRGRQKDVHPFYKEAHCVVLPSYHEGMANVMLEAASTGRPVITTTVPGCRETFDEGITGFGCEAGDTGSLMAAMRRITELPWEERREMGLAGRKKVSEEFDRSIVIREYFRQVEDISLKTAQ